MPSYLHTSALLLHRRSTGSFETHFYTVQQPYTRLQYDALGLKMVIRILLNNRTIASVRYGNWPVVTFT